MEQREGRHYLIEDDGLVLSLNGRREMRRKLRRNKMRCGKDVAKM